MQNKSRVNLLDNFLNGDKECHVAIVKRGWFRIFDSYESWVHIEKKEKDTGYTLTWTSHRDAHYPLIDGRSAYLIDIDDNGELEAMYETAITLWIRYHKRLKPNEEQRIRGEKVAEEIFKLLDNLGERE
jgi:hypothetical protein